MKTKSRSIFDAAIRVLLLLAAAALLIWGHYDNDGYKERNDIDTTAGATQLAG